MTLEGAFRRPAPFLPPASSALLPWMI